MPLDKNHFKRLAEKILESKGKDPVLFRPEPHPSKWTGHYHIFTNDNIRVTDRPLHSKELNTYHGGIQRIKNAGYKLKRVNYHGKTPDRYILKSNQLNMRLKKSMLIKAKTSTKIQSVLFSKDHFKSVDDVKKWLKNYGLKYPGVDETENYYRVRQASPGKMQDESFRTITLRPGVKAVIAKPQRMSKAMLMSKNKSNVFFKALCLKKFKPSNFLMQKLQALKDKAMKKLQKCNIFSFKVSGEPKKYKISEFLQNKFQKLQKSKTMRKSKQLKKKRKTILSLPKKLMRYLVHRNLLTKTRKK